MKAYFKNKWKEWDCKGDCSLPRVFGIKKWWVERFNDFCKRHDIYYLERIWVRKIYADFKFAAEVAEKGYPYKAVGAYIAFWVIGTPYWLWKKYSKKFKS